MQYLLENHFNLQDTFKRTMNDSSQRKLRKLYSTHKLVVKMKLNKLLASRMITPIHTRRGRAVKLKSNWYQLAVDILIKRKFNSFIRKQCIQNDSTKYKDFHNIKILREKIAKPLHSVTIEHSSKSRKLNEVGNIFLDLFDLNKYTLTTTISYMIDDVEAIHCFQNNGSELMGVFYCLTLKLNSKHSINYFVLNMQMIIIIKDIYWHDRVAYQNSLGIFPCSVVPDKKLRFSSHIYLLSLLLDQLSPEIWFETKNFEILSFRVSGSDLCLFTSWDWNELREKVSWILVIFKVYMDSTRRNEQNPEIVSKSKKFGFSANFVSKHSFYKNRGKVGLPKFF